MSSTVLVTGVAGFIGSHLAERLVLAGRHVVGVDVLAPTAPAVLQQERLGRLEEHHGFSFERLDVVDELGLSRLLRETERVDAVVHLAARAGVRASVEEPTEFVRTNVLGFMSVLEAARECEVPHLLYASSSSVYGELAKVPFTPHDPVGHPVSVYAATKRADELLAHSYAHLHGLPSTGLRFFTVYGPRGRPDMAYWRFAQAILSGSPISLYGDGSVVRDFTYVDDIVDALVALIDRPPSGDPKWSPESPDAASSVAPFAIHNIGQGGQASVTELISLVETALGRKASIDRHPPQAGDVPRTWSDTSSLERVTGLSPSTALVDGINRFVDWFVPWFEEHGPVG